MLGTAIAKGLEVYYKRLKACSLGSTVSSVDVDDSFEAALQVLSDNFQGGTEWTLEGLSKLITMGLKAGIKTGFPLGGEIVAVEEKLEYEVPDLIYRNVEGELIVIDHKVVVRQSPDYVDSKLMSYDTSWQLAHYAYKVTDRYQEPCRTGVHLITLSPKIKAYTHFTPRWTDERLAMWGQDASEVWKDMKEAEINNNYRRNWNHCQAYGTTPERRCEMFTLCHELNGDEGRAGVFYDRKGEAPVSSDD